MKKAGQWRLVRDFILQWTELFEPNEGAVVLTGVLSLLITDVCEVFNGKRCEAAKPQTTTESWALIRPRW